MRRLLFVVACSLLALAACTGPRKATLPVDSPLKTWTPPDEVAEEEAPAEAPAETPVDEVAPSAGSTEG